MRFINKKIRLNTSGQGQSYLQMRHLTSRGRQTALYTVHRALERPRASERLAKRVRFGERGL